MGYDPAHRRRPAAPGGGGATGGGGPGRTHPPCYYEIVYLSRQAHAISGGRSWRYNSAALPTMHFFLGLVEPVLALLVMLGILLQSLIARGLRCTIGRG